MRRHAIAVALAILAACGESLPAADDPDAATSDGGSSDANSPDRAEGGDAYDASCVAPCNAVEVVAAKPRAIAASSRGLIWLVSDDVLTLADGGPTTLMKPLNNGTATGFLTMNAGDALMTQRSGVDRCSIDAPCADNPAAPIFGLAETGPLIVGNGDIYAADRSGQRRLVTCSLSGTCGPSPPVIAYLPETSTRITLTTAHVVVGFVDGTLRAYLRSDRLDAGAPVPTPIASTADLRGLAADGTDIYWTDGTNGTISRCSVTSCAASKVDVLTGRKFPRAIAIDGMRRAYWVEQDDDAVVRCTLPACADVTVIARIRLPTDLALGDRVYVASETSQRIYAITP